MKARRDWIEEEETQYLNGPMPLGVLSHRVGMDTIEVAGGLAGHGVKLKVAVGNLDERESASRAVRENARRGCVLDLRNRPIQAALQGFCYRDSLRR